MSSWYSLSRWFGSRAPNNPSSASSNWLPYQWVPGGGHTRSGAWFIQPTPENSPSPSPAPAPSPAPVPVPAPAPAGEEGYDNFWAGGDGDDGGSGDDGDGGGGGDDDFE